MATPRHILVGTDFSDASAAALDTARDYAVAMGAKLSMLHVYAPGLDSLGPALSLAERMDTGRKLHDALGKLKARADGVPVVHAEVLEADDAVTALCDYAAANAVDLIVVGSHGRSGVKRLLIGSVAERVTRHAGCSVLIARG